MYKLLEVFAHCVNVDLSVTIDMEGEEKEESVKKKSDGPGKQQNKKESQLNL